VPSTKQRRSNDDTQLWVVALLVSVVLNFTFLAWLSVEAIKSEQARKRKVVAAPTPEQTVKIFPEMIQQLAEEEPPKQTPAAPPQAVRTSEDQEISDPAASRRYIGERNTQATSDRPPSSDDKTMPSQAGRKARPEEAPETTQSEYRDGKLDASRPAPKPLPNPEPLTPETAEPSTAESSKGQKSQDPGEENQAETAIREKILDGPNPVDTPVAKAELRDDIKPREEVKARDGAEDGITEKKADEKPKPKRAPIDDPAFSGNQRKTAILGSISRSGRSALNVTDTPMGRYQSEISRAVEKEWQLNCVKHRDFITPGYLTIRFFVSAEGRVKSVQFVGNNETGEVQKGFTLNAIRNAPIPAMPPAVKKEMGGDALELIFNFYF
jgi:hypothetical protein